jgi:stress responsive alpha/beta barrel protein
MKLLLTGALTMALTAFLFFAAGRHKTAEAAEGKQPMLIHNVYFTLKDNSPEARQKLVAACKKYLSKHPGTVFFAAGTRAEDLKRPVNVLDWDVGLHIAFKDRTSHDKYQEAESHKQFIAENKDDWKSVRVFDTTVEP